MPAPPAIADWRQAYPKTMRKRGVEPLRQLTAYPAFRIASTDNMYIIKAHAYRQEKKGVYISSAYLVLPPIRALSADGQENCAYSKEAEGRYLPPLTYRYSC